MPPKAGRRKKALLIGINYTGSQHELSGCHADIENVGRFLDHHGYPPGPKCRVVLRDDLQGKYMPTGVNMLAAMDWLVSEPNTTCFLHYSGHGGQVKDPDHDRPTGFDDTIVPVDFEQRGQIVSDVLHEHLVTKLAPNSTLFVVLDCCHSGSALELPFVYKSDDSGNISVMDNVKAGMKLLSDVNHLIRGGISLQKAGEARALYGEASNFFRSFGGGGHGSSARSDLPANDDSPGQMVEDTSFVETGERANENKMVSMFSGCADEQTSADANIKGNATGAMSWAFMKALREDTTPTYGEILVETRKLLRESRYAQVPQLSMGTNMKLEHRLMI